MTQVLERTASQLARLRDYYGRLALEAPSEISALATILRDRERSTVSALESWTGAHAYTHAAWVRQAGPFPYHPATPDLPDAPDAAALTRIADETDQQLRALFERLRTYAAAEGARDDVEGLLAISGAREQSLGSVVRELVHG